MTDERGLHDGILVRLPRTCGVLFIDLYDFMTAGACGALPHQPPEPGPASVGVWGTQSHSPNRDPGRGGGGGAIKFPPTEGHFQPSR